MGINKDLFINSVSQWFLCIICKNMVEDPVITDAPVCHLDDGEPCTSGYFCRIFIQTRFDQPGIKCQTHHKELKFDQLPPVLLANYTFSSNKYSDFQLRCEYSPGECQLVM